MAALEGSNRATVESWLGPIEEGDGFGQEADLLDRLDRLVIPELVALEVLRAELAQLSRLATSVRGDDVASDHKANLEAMETRISELTTAIRNDEGITLTDAGEKLVAGSEGGSAEDQASVITVNASRARRG